MYICNLSWCPWGKKMALSLISQLGMGSMDLNPEIQPQYCPRTRLLHPNSMLPRKRFL